MLSGQTCVVTGGASGIGEGIVRACAEAGATVVFGDIDVDRGQTVAASVNGRAIFWQTDVTNERDVAQLIDAAVRQTGRLDGMINNAGALGPYLGIADHSDTDIDRQVALLFKSVIWGTKHAGPIMRAARRGSIVNTASIAGLVAGYGPHLYTALKHAVVGLTKSTATEFAPDLVRINAICPGGILTNLAVASAGGGETGESFARSYLQQLQPMPTVGLPADIAAAAVFLISDAARFITGQTLTVDGGALSGRPWRTDFG